MEHTQRLQALSSYHIQVFLLSAHVLSFSSSFATDLACDLNKSLHFYFYLFSNFHVICINEQSNTGTLELCFSSREGFSKVQ